MSDDSGAGECSPAEPSGREVTGISWLSASTAAPAALTAGGHRSTQGRSLKLEGQTLRLPH